MISNIYELTRRVVDWCDSIYPDRKPDIVLSKLIEELEELKDRPCDGPELADVGILLLDYCDLVGIDLAKVIHWKMLINEDREWEIDETGKLQHKRSAESGPRSPLAHCRHSEEPVLSGAPMECGYDFGEDIVKLGTKRFCPDPECPICPHS